MDKRFDKAIELIKKGKRFIVVSHVNPEGDAVGSVLGLALSLRGIGKEAIAYLEDPVPEVYGFLPGSDTVVHSLEGTGAYDATFALDCGQKDRLGEGFMRFRGSGPIVNIDHHATNSSFGDVNIIVPDASATGELVYDLCKAASINIDPDAAVNLYVAIHTDTGSFRYSSATPEAFIKAGELVRLGARPWDISKHVYENFPERKYKLLGLTLTTLEVVDVVEDRDAGKVATLVITQEMFRKTGAEKDLSDGFVNYARGIEGVEVGVLFKENGPMDYKVSLRSKGNVDVSWVAQVFGGGGHRNAAGFNIRGTMEEVKEKVISVLRKKMLVAERA